MTGRPESPKTLARVRTPIAGASLRGIAATGRRRIAPLTVAVLLAACASLDPPARVPATYQPVAGLGESRFAVTAGDAQARALFGHGLQLLYAFEHAQAARVFRAALARDPTCAMCAWGVALAQAPNINNDNRGPVGDIRRHIARAQAAAAGVTSLERALIDAMAVRYGRADEREQRAWEARGVAMCAGRPTERSVDAQELAYAAAMADVVQRFGDDPDVVTLYADAVMTTSPWDWWDRKTGAPTGAMADVVARLRTASERHPQHTGAMHLLIHAAEQSPAPGQAEAAADRLARIAPGAPHLVHMPSHIYQHLGRFADATRVNQEALEVQKRYDAALAAQGVSQRAGGWDYHHQHFLWFAALKEGRFELALATARAFEQRFSAIPGGHGEYALMLAPLTALRAQQWDEVLARPAAPPGLGVAEAFRHAARAIALARTGRPASAQKELAEFDSLMDLGTVRRARLFREPAPELLRVAGAWARGEIARAEGRHEAAIAALRQAADWDDEAGGEPPRLAASGRLALVGALLAAGRHEEAAKETAATVKHYGPNAWTQMAELRLAQARGDSAQAAAASERLRVMWQAADRADLPAL
jgi:tetratricopeptide (TPR) repeat protein